MVHTCFHLTYLLSLPPVSCNHSTSKLKKSLAKTVAISIIFFLKRCQSLESFLSLADTHTKANAHSPLTKGLNFLDSLASGQLGFWPSLWGFQGRSLAAGFHWAGLTGMGLLLYSHACCKCRSSQELLRKLEKGDFTHSRFFCLIHRPCKRGYCQSFTLIHYSVFGMLNPTGKTVLLALHIFCYKSLKNPSAARHLLTLISHRFA